LRRALWAKYRGASGSPSRTAAMKSLLKAWRRYGFDCFSAPIVELGSSLRCAPQSEPAPCAGRTRAASPAFESFCVHESYSIEASAAADIVPSRRSGLPTLPTKSVSPVKIASGCAPLSGPKT